MAVLLSGSGTTLANILEWIGRGQLQARVELVLSDRPGVFGLTRAQNAGIDNLIVDRKACSGIREFEERIFNPIRSRKLDLVVMAGFLRLLPIPSDFTHRVMNIHPSLIPAFCGKGFHGLKVHQAALDMGVKVSGCTVHFADNEYDHGPIILQKTVPVLEEDTAETLAKRVFEAECQAYPTAIGWFAQGRIQIEGNRTRIRPPSHSPDGAL